MKEAGPEKSKLGKDYKDTIKSLEQVKLKQLERYAKKYDKVAAKQDRYINKIDTKIKNNGKGATKILLGVTGGLLTLGAIKHAGRIIQNVQNTINGMEVMNKNINEHELKSVINTGRFWVGATLGAGAAVAANTYRGFKEINRYDQRHPNKRNK